MIFILMFAMFFLHSNSYLDMPAWLSINNAQKPGRSAILTRTVSAAAAKPDQSDNALRTVPSGEESIIEESKGEKPIAVKFRSVSPNARVVRFTTRIEDAIYIQQSTFVERLLVTLNDRKGWPASQKIVSEYTKSNNAGLVIWLANPKTVDRICHPLQTNGLWNCWSGKYVMLNKDRWFNGYHRFKGSLDDYRHYMINHEVGHFLGGKHRTCVETGRPAPIMMQQSKGSGACVINAWPLKTELASVK